MDATAGGNMLFDVDYAKLHARQEGRRLPRLGGFRSLLDEVLGSVIGDLENSRPYRTRARQSQQQREGQFQWGRMADVSGYTHTC